MLGFFFRHYLPWVERFVIYDDGSDDNSNEIISSQPNAELRHYTRTHPDSFVLSQLHFLNNCWKESRGKADWVIVTDIDEHLYHPDIENYLLSCKAQRITVIPALGYQMITSEFPGPDEHLSITRTNGAPFTTLNKLSIFNPDAVKEANFTEGRHGARPVGRIKIPREDEMLLLHYKYLGFKFLLEKHSCRRERRTETDRLKGFGRHYYWDEDKLREKWKSFESALVDITSPEAAKNHRGPRWWREQRLLRRLRNRLSGLFTRTDAKS
jgi:glycosyltransferase involved in cell wall biosynthesis